MAKKKSEKEQESHEADEAPVIEHHNEEAQFWDALSKPSKNPKDEKVGDVEKEMSGGTKTAWDLWRNEITKLTRHERIAYATLKDCPLFGDLVRDLTKSKRNEKAWLAKHLFPYFKEHMRAFTNVYHNKKIQKALNKMGYNQGSQDNW